MRKERHPSYTHAMRAVLVGNYGVGNVGDEALKAYFLRTFADVEWQILSAHPAKGEFHRLPGGLRSFLFTPWWKTIAAMRHADAVIFGGGTLLTDVESSYACFLWFLHALIARSVGTPVLLAFQGIGPFVTQRGEWFARATVRLSRFLSVRDSAAASRVHSWNLNINIIQTFDPIYSVISNQNTVRSKDILTLIPRQNSSDSFQKCALEHWRSRRWDAVYILSLAPESAREHSYCQMLAREIADAQFVPVDSVETLSMYVGQSAFVLTERYHGAIAALALRIPFAVISQGRGDKLAEIAQMAQDHDSREIFSAWVFQGEDALRDALRYHTHSHSS